MQLLRLHTLDQQQELPATAVTVGNFDGVHRGHQAMIQQLKNIAQQQGLKTGVMIFEPQPLEFFKGQDAPPRISALREKIEMFKQLGVDYVAVAKFDADFRALSARQFGQLLTTQLNAQHLVLGDDFHFGRDRSGNSEFLRQTGFQVSNLDTIQYDNKRISSTRIRQTLQMGDFALAAQLLGRPYHIMGRILHGDKIGRTLDFPTINVALHRHKPCLQGIYAVEVSAVHDDLSQVIKQNHPQLQGMAGYHAQHLFGAAHVGIRPAIAQDQPTWRLEVHFPDVQANLYGRLVKVTFLHYLHGERYYPSLSTLKAGIAEDVLQLRQYRQQQQDFPFNVALND